MMDEGELTRYFTSWEYSLLQLKEERIGQLRIRGIEDTEYLEEKNFEAAIILLKKEGEGRIPAYFNQVFEEDPDNIHAWCIKGMYHLRRRPAELEEAQEARERMEALMREERPMNEAKVEKAYWLHQRDGSEGAKKKAYELFDSVAQLSVSQNALYLQVLVADLIHTSEVSEPTKKKIQNLIHASANILKSGEDQHILGVWLGLLDVLGNTTCRRLLQSGQVDGVDMTILLEGDEEFTESFCEKKLSSMEDNPNIIKHSSFYAKISKAFKNKAWHENNVEKRERLLYSALEFAEKYKKVPASSFDQAPRVCAQILLGIWAIKYLETNRDLVEKDYNKKRSTSQGFSLGLWRHASTFYYSRTHDTSPATNLLLEKAHEHLKEYGKPNTNYYVPEYARVLMLLGEPVEEAVKQMTGSLLKQAKGSVFAHQGLFHEAVGNDKEAINCYRQATEVGDSYHVAVKMARTGLERLTPWR